MASYGIIENFKTKKNPSFLGKAAALAPLLNRHPVRPTRLVEITETHQVVQSEWQVGETEGRRHDVTVRTCGELEDLERRKLKKGDRVTLDFGNHQVGYVSFHVQATGSHFDAPAYIRMKFAEIPCEILEDSSDYHGWISKSWIQEEYLHLDFLPATVKLPRRYAFRYMLIEVLDTSPKYALKISEPVCEYVSAVEMDSVPPLHSGDALLDQIDRVGLKTLMNCTQMVFEDGVKRDRRLWLGDLRLQALANYCTFRNYDMVKRCLYLFAGETFEDGRIGACFFHEPEPCVDDTYLMDYALLFVPTLFDYYEASGDLETLQELYPLAMRQIDICLAALDKAHLVVDKGEDFWCFLDWGEGLNKQAGAQAVLIYSIHCGIRMARVLGDEERAASLSRENEALKKAAVQAFWDEDLKLFVSGQERQVSWASQVWMILAQVFDRETNRKLIHRTRQKNPRIHMVTPYMYHHYIDALIRCDERELALEEIKRYWGGMIRDGADTFWELYDPDNKYESPYGSCMVNSYCHAWSCTPSYFVRKFGLR
ncbi:MAG: sugar hydrolase [Clostridiales bacterium]|nr:sugar hydrolase [Clostridiales bacterium]